MDREVLPPQHQVFISFRGDELRNNFISHLVDALRRNTINVFTDREEKKGEDINNLFKKIEESKIAVAVFSRRYTESRWCLDELVKMKERADLGKLKVFPVFYNVTTNDVKLLEGDFGMHFRRREWEYRSEQRRVDKWREALACVSGKIGLPFDDKRFGYTKAMVLDGIVSSPLRRHQSLKKQWEDLGSCSSVINRHRYLLTALALLGFLCTVYLYFAVTLGASHSSSCYGLVGKEKAMCQLQHVQVSPKGNSNSSSVGIEPKLETPPYSY